MELLVESIAEEKELSQYEIERNKPMPSRNHSIVQSTLSMELGMRYRKEYSFFSELNITMPTRPDTVPDIAIYPKMKIDFLHDVISMEEMPLTVIEIISSSQSNDDILAKFERYFFAGVQSCWLVQPSMKAIYVYSQIGKYQFFNDEMTLIDKLTGIELPLNEVFS
jgi:Uma2 family endonuclease